MINRNNDAILFPHVFPGNVLGGKTHTYNSINGGLKKIGDFGLAANSFFGGVVSHLGYITEYGFYACPHSTGKQILGFYLYKPDTVTELGKKILAERFPNHKVIYAEYNRAGDVPVEDPELRKKLIEEFKEVGGNPMLLRTVTSNEIMSLIKAIKAGASAQPMAEQEQIELASAVDAGEEVKAVSASKGRPPKAAIDSMMAKGRRS